MNVLGLALITFAKILKLLIDVYTFLILGSVLISWFRPDPYNPVVRFIRQTTEPVLGRIRKLLPESFFRTGIDFTPLILFAVLIVLETFVVGLLFEYGWKLRAGSGFPGLTP